MTHLRSVATSGSETRVAPLPFERSAIGECAELDSAEWEIISQRRHQGVIIAVWRSRKAPYAGGVAAVRMSKKDMKGGETAMSQLAPLLSFCAHRNLALGHVVIAVECSGGRDYWGRPDLVQIQELIADGLCEWVLWRDVSRMARDRRTFIEHTDLLESADVDLYIEQLGRRIDWNDFNDRLMLHVFCELAILERQQTFLRTHGGIEEQWILTGKGLGSAVRFGFERDESGWLRVCDDEWPWVQAICFGLAELKRQNDTGLEALARLLQEAGGGLSIDDIRDLIAQKKGVLGLRTFELILKKSGCKRSAGQIADILNDPLYVTGGHFINWEGLRVEMKPVDIPDPIPMAVHQLNLRLLAESKGTSVNTRLCEFVVRDLLVCGQCGAQFRPRFEEERGQPALYRRNGAGCATCQGLTIPRDAVDPLVIRELLATDASKRHRLEAWERARDASGDPEWWEERLAAKQELASEVEALQSELQERLQAILAESVSSPNFDLTSAVEGERSRKAELMCRERALQRFEAIAKHERRQRPRLHRVDPELQARFESVLTLDLPDTLEERATRAQVVSACLSKVLVHCEVDEAGAKTISIELQGPLCSKDRPPYRPIAPSTSARDSLDGSARTVSQAYAYDTVRAVLSDPDFKRPSASSGGSDCDGEPTTPSWLSERLTVHLRPGTVD